MELFLNISQINNISIYPMTNKASFLVFLCFIISSIAIDMNNPKAVYTIPYTRTFRKDLFA